MVVMSWLRRCAGVKGGVQGPKQTPKRASRAAFKLLPDFRASHQQTLHMLHAVRTLCFINVGIPQHDHASFTDSEAMQMQRCTTINRRADKVAYKSELGLY